jgi:tetratricopeptide (TPR) repeat protein
VRNRLLFPELTVNARTNLRERLLSFPLRGLWTGLRAMIATRYARVAERRGDRDESLRRWQAIIERMPDDAFSYVGRATALRKLARLDEADGVLVSGMQRLPSAPDLACEYALNADLRFDGPESLRRWQAVRERFPDEPMGYAGLGAALKFSRRLDEAEAVMAAGLARFPDNNNLAINYAWLAMAREDWPLALRLWQDLRQCLPNDRGVAGGLDQTLWHLRLAAADELAAAGEAAPGSSNTVPAASSEPAATLEAEPAYAQHRALFMKFESLGENCELGFVQRHYGAEPLGLLRWAGMTYPKLSDALANGFAGIGDPGNTVLVVNSGNHEYMISDRHFDMHMHTFIFENKEQEEIIFQKLCRRLRYLRDKFLDDLANPEKILVFQDGEQATDQDMVDLHAALQRYGDNRLLYVRPQRSGRAAGEVEIIGDGLLAGYVDRPGYEGGHWDISFECWLTLCQKVDRLWP